MQTALDPEQELRKRLQTRLAGGELSTTLGASPSNAPIPSAQFAPVDGGSPDPIDQMRPGDPRIPPTIGTPKFLPEAQPRIPPPYQTQSTMPRAGEDGGYTPPDPPPYLPTTPTPIQPNVPVVTPGTGTTGQAADGTRDSRLGIPGGPETRPNTPTIETAASALGTAPSGWDQTKWDDPNHTSTKYVVGRILAKYPPTVQGLQQAFAEIKAQFPGASFNGKDTLSGLPGTAGPVDVLMNASSGGSGWWWGDSGASGGAGGGAGAGAAGAGAAGGGASSLTMPTSPFQQQLRATLLERIAAAQQPVNESDANIADPLSAARDEVSRGTDEERKRLAERLYAQGSLNSGELTQGITQSSERNATGLSQLRAGLISKEYTARRDELQNYMQLAIASGDAEMARQLQLEIANLNAAVQREGIGVGWAEFIAGLNQRTTLAGLNGA